MGAGCFDGCTALKKLKLSKGLTEIPEACFRFTDLKSLTIPDGVTSIGDYAFCFGDTSSFSLPSTLEEIGLMAFASRREKATISYYESDAARGRIEIEQCYKGYTLKKKKKD